MFNSRQVRRAFCEKPQRKKSQSSRRDYDQTTVAFSAMAQCDTVEANEMDETPIINGDHKKSTASDIVAPLPDRQQEKRAAEKDVTGRSRLSLHDSTPLVDTQEEPLRLRAHYAEDGVTIRRVVPLSRVACFESTLKKSIIVPNNGANSASISR